MTLIHQDTHLYSVQVSLFYTTTKGGSMTQERLLNFINQVIIKHTDGAPAALFLDAASYQVY